MMQVRCQKRASANGSDCGYFNGLNASRGAIEALTTEYGHPKVRADPSELETPVQLPGELVAIAYRR